MSIIMIMFVIITIQLILSIVMQYFFLPMCTD